MQYEVEYTDTFGGDANYSWVRRATIEAPDAATDRTLLRMARRALNLTGLRGRVVSNRNAELIELRPYGCCTVLFITPAY